MDNWRETSRPYRILAGALEIRQKGLQDTPRGKELLALAEQTVKELEADATLSDYGKFRLEGFKHAGL
jgi:hypothetical protein